MLGAVTEEKLSRGDFVIEKGISWDSVFSVKCEISQTGR